MWLSENAVECLVLSLIHRRKRLSGLLWAAWLTPVQLPRWADVHSNGAEFKQKVAESQPPAGLTLPADGVADPGSAAVTGARRVNHCTSATKSHNADPVHPPSLGST